MYAIVIDPKGKKHIVEGANSAAINHAVNQMFPDPEQEKAEKARKLEEKAGVEKAEKAKRQETEAARHQQLLTALAANRPQPPQPQQAIPPFPEPIPPIPHDDIINALGTHGDYLEKHSADRHGELMAAVREFRDALKEQTASLKRISALLAAPRKLVRDESGKPTGSTVSIK